jgi:hypothetical protein
LKNYLVNQMYNVKSSPNSEKNQLDLYPLSRVSVTENGHVYFVPVSKFPIPNNERTSIRHFLIELWERYLKSVESDLISCLGILNKALEFEVLETVCDHVFDWRSKVAIALFPNQPPPHVPTREEIMSWKEAVSGHDVIPMITYITKSDVVREAHKKLFGCGGTILYISPHEKEKFFAKTKEIFGYKLTKQCFQFMDCLPVLEIGVLLEATNNQFRALYSAIGLYIAESMRDGGIVIISDRKLDREIADLVYLLPDGRKRGTSGVRSSLERLEV